METYPNILIEQLAKFGCQPSGDANLDMALLKALRYKTECAPQFLSLHEAARKASDELHRKLMQSHALEEKVTYQAHVRFLLFIANNIVLAPQRRKFVIDDDNRDVLRFLLYYFNNCPLAEEVFPGRGYKLHKSILLQGGVGVGKTMLMQIFSEYLRRTNSPHYFHCVSVTQMVNYYTKHNNLDLFTYNEGENRGFQCKPANICLNDIGIQDKTFFGMDTGLLTDEFLHARNEIWTQYGKNAHLTTNLDNNQLRKRFEQHDVYGRIIDRFKTYNIIPMTGNSRR